MTHEEKRRLWIAFHKRYDEIARENERRHHSFVQAAAAGRYRPYEGELERPRFPAELRNLTCGARTRRDTMCKQTDLAKNGRCKFHGGKSTGPKSIDGKLRAAANLTLRWPSEPHEGV